VVCDCNNHLILSAITTRGPSPDVNQFCKTLKPAADQFRIKHLLADAGYDSEKNHQYARDVHQIKTTIPPKHGRPTTKLPKTKYRREMRTDFDTENYGQRWQVETVFSMIKRNFGSALRARRYWSQCREMMLLAITHNIAVILLVKELFYRALQNHLKIKYDTPETISSPRMILFMDASKAVIIHMGVNLRGFNIRVPQHFLQSS